jgi:hypothetical protein
MQALSPYAIAVVYIEVLPNVSARIAWEARLSAEYGRTVVMLDAYDNAVRTYTDPPFWGMTYLAGANGSLVHARARARLHVRVCVCVCMCACAGVCVCVCVFVCACVCV